MCYASALACAVGRFKILILIFLAGQSLNNFLIKLKINNKMKNEKNKGIIEDALL